MNEHTITLDVRGDIHAGREPLSAIMNAVDRLGVSEDLVILAPFEPRPLYYALAKKGFRHDSQQIATGDWQVRFTRDEAAGSAAPAGVTPAPTVTANAQSAAVTFLDVDARGLEPPQPMVTILEALAALPPGGQLRARTDRRPMHLYAQLEERGFQGETQEQADGSYITHIQQR